MGSKWKECELGDFIELKRGYDLPKSTRNEGSIPIISSSGFTDFHDKPMVKGPGVVTGRYGTIGEVFYSEEDFWPLNTTLYVVDFKGNDPLFVYYLLQTISYADYTDKAAVPGVNRNHLHKAKVKVPIYLDIQQKVAAQLYQLEKRVTLGKQINQTLEQMSQTLFKSWFVDFDPVIDNALDAGNPIPEALQSRAELRQKVRSSADFKPLPADIRALFPAEFEETELGWVPKDWYHKNAEEIATISIGKTPPRNQKECFSHKKDSNYTWVSIKDLGNCNVFIKESSEYLTTDAVNNYNVKIVPKGAVLLSFKLTIGRIAIAESILTTNEAIAHFYNMKHGVNKEYLYSYLQHFDYNTLGSTSSIATAVNSKIIRKIPILLPDTDILHQYKISTDIIFKRISFNNRNTYDLTALRDTLLPKLISGELSLEDLPDLVNQTEPA
ncbi:MULTISPECIES: restriction endonuclease subunit S [Klebsiella]|uniref:HsdS n=3 Tax=Klebsiella TaxID=570 RepID=O34140_KLEPN|nr:MULTISPECIES: restriction endonuclease subunit S [Klebsiella]AAB70708.1 HsdS [Klebsiella pneumoniae]EKP26371.1 restriction modification system DNA specificity domain-containing protein [Klebsiella michiganensis]QLT66725.1 restriction endonuclease subunit S [Klebsiella oxytoca]ARI06685.1 restriction endonuclease [Klebsiella sp. M5al]KZT48719.1 restriction endonuclease [Klebsiella michiganensis]